MKLVIVSHFHWDREWHRTFEGTRARLVDAVDRVLALLEQDPGYRFVLDGQAVLLEDYLALRPARRDALARGLRTGRLSAGPWYVQPDSLVPSGESHVRNLLLGRATVGAMGAVASRVGYVPDSFGHPAQFPQILAGFGLGSFVYWRGNGDECDELGNPYRWQAPDGSSAVTAVLLRDGYFNAACLPDDPDEAAGALRELVRANRAARPGEPVLLLNGFDHTAPDGHLDAVLAALARHGDDSMRFSRGLLEDALATLPAPAHTYRGELTGARLTNLLPGVWSTRTDVKLAHRACEALLEGWAEPFCALLGAALPGLADERAALDHAWRGLLQSQAHDSLCGCSIDPVMADVVARIAGAHRLASETLARVLERAAGLPAARNTPATVEPELCVYNPSPHARTDVVRVPLEGFPAMRLSVGSAQVPPLALAALDPPGFTVDGVPARVVPAEETDSSRVRWFAGQTPFDLEFVARDVPAFGCRRVKVQQALERQPDAVDDEGTIAVGALRVTAEPTGTLAVQFGDRAYAGLFALEDLGDRGDTYDFDPVHDGGAVTLERVSWERRVHPSGLARLIVRRVLRVPARLADDRLARATECVELPVTLEARLAPDVARVDVRVTVDNTAHDHRLRAIFPVGEPVARFRAATTFDTIERTTARRDDSRWVHPAPETFAHQGWVEAGGLTVVAPGLCEAQVTTNGAIAITLLRAVGWLARMDVRSRPVPAGPVMRADAAQCVGRLSAQVSLLGPGATERDARDAELGLRGVIAGTSEPRAADGASWLSVEPRELVVTAVKPAEDGGGFVVRVLNPTGSSVRARVRCGVAFRAARSVRLDESEAEAAGEAAVERVGGDRVVVLEVPPRALRSVRFDTSPGT